jgi:hypothetical protein
MFKEVGHLSEMFKEVGCSSGVRSSKFSKKWVVQGNV